MLAIHVVDVNEALPRALAYLRDRGKPEGTRNGPALVAPGPVATVYLNPRRRVLFDPTRDANPFFHLFESLWILAGRRDVQFLSWFNSRIADYSDDGRFFHAAYGYRLRCAFGGTDQIEEACHQLRANPASRRAVLQIWSAQLDMNVASRDLPCNDVIMLRVQDDTWAKHESGKALDITVCNRSNDAIWGAYGANAVQFSFIQEYMAHKIGVGVGTYTQMSNNLHVYTENPYWKTWVSENSTGGVFIRECEYDREYDEDEGAAPRVTPLIWGIETPGDFDADLATFFQFADTSIMAGADSAAPMERAVRRAHSNGGIFNTGFFSKVVLPMLSAFVNRSWDELDPDRDWCYAGAEWLQRRAEAKQAKAGAAS